MESSALNVVGRSACALLLAVNLAHAQMTVHHINVGQADATLLEFKSAAVLIDSGGQDETESGQHLINYLTEFFKRRPDLVAKNGQGVLYSVITTHPHIDHNKHLMRVMTGFNVLNLVDNGDNNPSKDPGWAPVLASRKFAAQHKILYNRISDQQIGANGYTTSHLLALKNSPSQVDIRFLNGFAGCTDPNNDSIVVMVEYKGRKILIAGDAEWDQDREFKCVAAGRRMFSRFAASGRLRADVYKVSHHGSANGTSDELVAAMKPSIAVMTAGHHSFRATGDSERYDAWHYGHPREETVVELERVIQRPRKPIVGYTMTTPGPKPNSMIEKRKIEKAIYCSCWDGDVVISVDESGQKLDVKTEH